MVNICPKCNKKISSDKVYRAHILKCTKEEALLDVPADKVGTDTDSLDNKDVKILTRAEIIAQLKHLNIPFLATSDDKTLLLLLEESSLKNSAN